MNVGPSGYRTDAGLSEYETLAASAEESSASQLIEDALRLLGRDRMCIVSSFGADSAVLLHIVSQVDVAIPVLFLETGKHFPETLAYKAMLTERLGLTDVRDLASQAAALASYDPTGNLWQRNPDQCCSIRKVVPLRRALGSFDCWATGRKRYQNDVRQQMPKVELVDGRIKLNPIAHFSAQNIADWFLTHKLPAHPLEADGYLSIGCMSCTDRVRPGERHRDGRWRGSEKSECGIHLPASPPPNSD